MTHGKLKAKIVNKHPEYWYRVAIQSPVTLRSIDPERLVATQEYPRDVYPPWSSHINYEEIMDFYTKNDRDVDGTMKVQVWLSSNKYTSAKEDKLIAECRMRYTPTPQEIEMFLKEAFRDGRGIC
jgi:hypothetical protein